MLFNGKNIKWQKKSSSKRTKESLKTYPLKILIQKLMIFMIYLVYYQPNTLEKYIKQAY